MTRFSAWSVFWNGLTGQKGWTRQWRDPEPQPAYDVVIVGGGLHGLATAYYLKKNHAARSVAVVEKGWLGGGNAGRNTTIVRSNYARPGNREFYEQSLKLWENLSHELNYNVMFSQRSHIALLHSPGAIDAAARNYNTMRADRRHRMRKYGISTTAETRCPAFELLARPRVFRSWALRCKSARVLPATMRLRGGMQEGPMRAAWIFFRQCEVVEGSHATATASSTASRPARGRDPLQARWHSRWPASTSQIVEHGGLGKVADRIPQAAGLCLRTDKTAAGPGRGVRNWRRPLLYFTIGQGRHGLRWRSGLVQVLRPARRNLPIVSGRGSEAAMSILPCLGRVKLLRHWSGLVDMSMDGYALHLQDAARPIST